jgi:hypothetical protein
LRWSVGIFALRVVVQDLQRQPGTAAGLGIFQHLPVASRVAEGDDGPGSDLQVNAFGLA